MNLRILSIITSGLSVFFLVLLLTRGCDKPTARPDDGELWRERVRQRDGVIKTKDSIIYALEAVRSDEKKEHQKDVSRLSLENKRLSVGYSRAKKDIEHLRDSLPAVNRYVEVTDSLLLAKDSLYLVEVHHGFMMEKSYQKQVMALADKNIQQVKISSLMETKIIDLESQNSKLTKRLERKKKFNRVLGGVALGLGTALGLIIATQ